MRKKKIVQDHCNCMSNEQIRLLPFAFNFCFNFRQNKLVIPRRIREWLKNEHKTSEKKTQVFIFPSV